MTERHRFPVLVHLLIGSGDRLLLLRRAGTGLFDGCWAPPGGHVEAGESPRAAALRETFEEVGVALDDHQLVAVGLLHYSGGGGGFNLIFAAELEDQPSPRFDPSSADAAEWWPRSALPAARVPWLDTALERARFGGDAGSAEEQVLSRVGRPWYVEGH